MSACLKRKGLAFADLSYLCVTHYHPDHAGLIQELKDRGIRHIVFEQQIPAIPRLKTYMKPESGYVDICIQDSIVLSTRESRAWLAKIGFTGKVVSTPGHSDDSISVVFDAGIAFTGGLLPVTMFEGEAAKAAGQSWARLGELNVRTIYPSHGPVRSLIR